MALSLLPDRCCRTIFDLEPQALAQAGVRLLLADLDNTLVAYGVPTAPPEVRAWRQALADCGVTLFILSNNRSATRAKVFAEDLGVPFLGHAGKPKPAAFHWAMAQQDCTPGQTAMVGDQIFTDILGARRVGVTAILVEPIRLSGNPGRYLRYLIELPFRAIGKRRTKAI